MPQTNWPMMAVASFILVLIVSIVLVAITDFSLRLPQSSPESNSVIY